jgi:hypothetical protein
LTLFACFPERRPGPLGQVLQGLLPLRRGGGLLDVPPRCWTSDVPRPSSGAHVTAAVRAALVRAATALAAGLLPRVGDLRRPALDIPLRLRARYCRGFFVAFSDRCAAVLCFDLACESSSANLGISDSATPGTDRARTRSYAGAPRATKPRADVHRPEVFHVERFSRHARRSCAGVAAAPPSSESF